MRSYPDYRPEGVIKAIGPIKGSQLGLGLGLALALLKPSDQSKEAGNKPTNQQTNNPSNITLIPIKVSLGPISLLDTLSWHSRLRIRSDYIIRPRQLIDGRILRLHHHHHQSVRALVKQMVLRRVMIYMYMSGFHFFP